MKQGITPQYWKQENNGRYFTKETQIFSPLPILTDTLLAHPKSRNDGQLAFPAIHFIEGISREVGQEVMQSFSLPYPSNPEAHIVKVAQDGIFVYALSQRGLFPSVATRSFYRLVRIWISSSDLWICSLSSSTIRL